MPEYALTPKHLRDVAWALDHCARLAVILLDPIATGYAANAGEVTVTAHLTMGPNKEPLTSEEAQKLRDWIAGDDMQRGLRQWADALEANA